MDALFVNLFVIILILILYPRQHSTILYVIKRNERRSAHPEGRYPMDRKLDDFLFYFPRIVMAPTARRRLLSVHGSAGSTTSI